MPEIALGLFPDAGASYFLSRLPGFFGSRNINLNRFENFIVKFVHLILFLLLLITPIGKLNVIVSLYTIIIPREYCEQLWIRHLVVFLANFMGLHFLFCIWFSKRWKKELVCELYFVIYYYPNVWQENMLV